MASSLALALAGCGGDDDETTSTTTSSTTSTEAKATVEGASEPAEVLGATVTSTTAGKPGAVVISVQEPSTRLREGDVITAVNGAKLASADEMVDAVGEQELGDSVRLHVTRGSHDFDLDVFVAPTTYLGLQIQDAKGGGAEVVTVQPKSPAAEAGFKVGDTVTAIDGGKIERGIEVTEVVADHEPGDEITVSVSRGSEELELDVTLAKRPTPKS